jgi:hypothetical protein
MAAFLPLAPVIAGVAVVGAALGGCAQLETAGGTSVAYDCDDDRNFEAAFTEDWDTASATTEDETYSLALVERDDDRLVYSDDDGDVRLVVDQDGEGAELEIEGGDDFENCRPEGTA